MAPRLRKPSVTSRARGFVICLESSASLGVRAAERRHPGTPKGAKPYSGLSPASSKIRSESRISKARFRLTIESEPQGKTG